MSKYILGVSFFYHDSSSCLLKDDKLICAFQEERFTRVKFDSSFPKNAINKCLEFANIKIKDIDCISFYENPKLKLDRLINTFIRYGKKPFKNAGEISKWFSEKYYIEEIIREELNFENDFNYYDHHESHAASAFYPSLFEESGIITMDGAGEWDTSTSWIGTKNNMKLVRKQTFPDSLGLFYSAFTYYCGFKVLSGEYKLMGLAPYGEPKYYNLFKDNLIQINEDGTIKLNLKYFEFQRYEKMFNSNLEDLLDLSKREKNENLNSRYIDIAASAQKIVEEVVIKNVNWMINEHSVENLCLAGGVALNCVANGKIDQNTKIKKLWIQPASGDSGTSIGAAYLALYKKYNFERNEKEIKEIKFSPYLGNKFESSEIKKTLDNFGFVYNFYNDDNNWKSKIVDLLIKNKVIGYFEGRMEFGPRALGSRSIIANPIDREMQKKLNLKIKYRESFRPFAPIVLDEYADEWFEIKNKNKYMLQTYFLKDEKKFKNIEEIGLKKIDFPHSEVPAVTHVDYSARAQILSKNDYEKVKLYEIIDLFRAQTGIPMIINTSFNIRGEPIVNSPLDALRCFMNTDMDYLVLENFILDKNKQNEFLLKDDTYISGKIDAD